MRQQTKVSELDATENLKQDNIPKSFIFNRQRGYTAFYAYQLAENVS